MSFESEFCGGAIFQFCWSRKKMLMKVKLYETMALFGAKDWFGMDKPLFQGLLKEEMKILWLTWR